MDVMYPDITVHFSGKDDHVFYRLGLVLWAMEEAGLSRREIDDFWREATSWDNDHAVQTCREWVNVT